MTSSSFLRVLLLALVLCSGLLLSEATSIRRSAIATLRTAPEPTSPSSPLSAAPPAPSCSLGNLTTAGGGVGRA